MPSVDKLQAEIEHLKVENARLVSLLETHGVPCTPIATPRNKNIVSALHPSVLSTDEKVALFRSLFRGRSDVYPIRWESPATGKAGYSPSCANEWKRGVCPKPRVKCSACDYRELLPLIDQTIYDHLAGKQTIGIYPLLADETCYFLAVDFDDDHWRDDICAFNESCRETNIPVSIEISRSGKGAHAWIFFSEAVSAREARRLGAALISQTCARTRQLSLASYDRFFPNQDTLPKGGFGNLIALPLQKKPRENGFSVFVDDQLHPFDDQWAYLKSVRKMSGQEVESAVFHIAGPSHPLDVAFVIAEEESEPWKRPPRDDKIVEPLPKTITLILADRIFVAKEGLPQPLANRLIRLAAFQNPEFYKAQAMRLPVWNKPRIIGCAENFPKHIALPRGCLDDIQSLLKKHGVACELQDERIIGSTIDIEFTGILRDDQEMAVSTMLRYDTGVLCAPTAFGKTVSAAALIARRRISTLIVVHRIELLNQWIERLSMFLSLDREKIGLLGGGKNKLSGIIDVAVMQTLTKKEQLLELLDHYGQVIIDECHHLSAFSFESILKQSKSRYIVGLTATPIRRDGHHPIIFMQCGPIRHTAVRPDNAPTSLKVVPRWLPPPEISADDSVQGLFTRLIQNEYRNKIIVQDILAAYNEGRKILVLTERTDHLERLHTELDQSFDNVFVLHGRLPKKTRNDVFSRLNALDDDVPRILLATGKLVGEGFDYPPLDTLMLAMPISWKGILQQYAGRLHRNHPTKTDVRIYDYVKLGHPLLARMWEKRVRGYMAMGYSISGSLPDGTSLIDPAINTF
ncbi:MAG: DEAD/DEAH box helicase [Planctomycetaceae bacterium]|jgi:superfamily II DNA or RNA helicase|nr:DEAD/DEAH box helicase [Planctomycetaceae bacterium]